MSYASKYIISAVLITVSLSILLYGYLGKQSTNSITKEIKQGYINIPVDLEAISGQFTSSATIQKQDPSKILPLMVLTTKVCPPCVNNVAEFAGLIRENPLFDEPILVFVEEDKNTVERFVLTTRLELSYNVIHPQKASPLFRNSEQNLIFVDPSALIAFYNTWISNSFTSVEYKKEQLEDVVLLWNKIFGENDLSVRKNSFESQ